MRKHLIIFTAFILIVACNFASAGTILIIESYHNEYAWDIAYKQAIHDVIGNAHQIMTFQMDTKRLPAEEHPKMAERAWQEYKKVNPDLVILGDDAALKYLGQKFGETKTPIVYMGINRNPRDYGVIGKDNFTGVLERPLFKRSIVFIMQIIVPEPKKILVLFDSDITSQASLAEVFKGYKTVMVQSVRVDLQLIGSFEEWQKTVLNAGKEGYGAIVIGLYQTLKDASGNHVEDKKVLNWTSQNAPVPPFAFWDFTVGQDKAIGGYVLFGKSQGEAAAHIALKILSGKSPKSVPPQIPENGRFFYSKSQLKKWNINLPQNVSSTADYTD